MQSGEMNSHTDELTKAIITMAIESWRFSRVFDRMLAKTDAGEQARYRNQLRWFVKKVEESLEQAGLLLVDVESHPYDPGLAATPLNLEEFAPGDSLIVDQMIEPIIMSKQGLVRAGTVTLKKVTL